MSLSSDHVIRAGQNYTISSPSGRGMSVDYKSVFRLAIAHTVLEKWAKKSENHEIWANFDPPPTNLFRRSQNFETSFGYFFSGTIAKKILDHPLTLRVGKKFRPPIFFGGGGPQGVHKLDIMTHYHL